MTWAPGSLLELRTERFILRTMLREDITDTVLGWLADPEVMLGMNLPRQRLTRPQGVRWAMSFDNHTKMCLLVTTAPESQTATAADAPAPAPQPIGCFTVHLDPQHRTAETAVFIGERVWWGRGTVVEARTALLDFLFGTLQVHKVTGRPHGRNFASIFNYKAMGFRCEAVLREQMLAVSGEQRLDQLTFGMLRREWLARRQGTATS